jgi:hypothetical protein
LLFLVGFLMIAFGWLFERRNPLLYAGIIIIYISGFSWSVIVGSSVGILPVTVYSCVFYIAIFFAFKIKATRVYFGLGIIITNICIMFFSSLKKQQADILIQYILPVIMCMLIASIILRLIQKTLRRWR